MSETLKRLRDAVMNRNRVVEVTRDGVVRDVETNENEPKDVDQPKPDEPKATKLSARVFGS